MRWPQGIPFQLLDENQTSSPEPLSDFRKNLLPWNGIDTSGVVRQVDAWQPRPILYHAYDEEVKGIVTSFAELLKNIVQTIDRRGLKRHFLRKHIVEVERFYRKLSQTTYMSETALKCKERFEKNRDKLFTFLKYDGVPWNNNNAEHAIKAFARLRRAIEGLSTPKGIEEYLILLSVCQTCKYMGVDFLDFLRSGERTFTCSRKVGRSKSLKRRSYKSSGGNMISRLLENS